MRISFMPAHAHLIFTCSCASHFCLRIRLSFLPAHAHLIFTCSCASRFGLRMRISFRLAHAHLNLACACASYFGLHMKTWGEPAVGASKTLCWSAPTKTKILIIGVPQLLRRVPSVAISILGKEITPVPVARDLGVFIDQNLTYDEHLTQTAAKCLCKLVQINRIKHLLDKETLLLLINAFVFSKLFYCSTVWSNTSKSNVSKLQRVQNVAARIILGFRKFDHISQGIKSLKWLPVKARLYLNDAIMMYKCINKLAPDYLADKLVQPSHIHNRNTRSRNQLDISRCRISTGQRSFVYRGTQLWNSLSYDVRTAKCPKVFKRRLINILLSS